MLYSDYITPTASTTVPWSAKLKRTPTGFGRGSKAGVRSRVRQSLVEVEVCRTISYRYLTGILPVSRDLGCVTASRAMPGLGQDARPTKQARLELGSFWRSAASTSGESSGAASSNARHVPVPGLPGPVHGRNKQLGMSYSIWSGVRQSLVEQFSSTKPCRSPLRKRGGKSRQRFHVARQTESAPLR